MMYSYRGLALLFTGLGAVVGSLGLAAILSLVECPRESGALAPVEAGELVPAALETKVMRTCRKVSEDTCSGDAKEYAVPVVRPIAVETPREFTHDCAPMRES